MQPIIIVGAGMVGLTAALHVAQLNIPVILIEANPAPKQHLPQAADGFDVKVVAINRASQRLFERLNVWQTMCETRIMPYQHMQVWDEVADGQIGFHAQDYFQADLGHIIEQQVIVGALWQAVKNHPSIEIRCGQTLQDRNSINT
jgi:2-polyprenylphenol 6-hydroxylase